MKPPGDGVERLVECRGGQIGACRNDHGAAQKSMDPPYGIVRIVLGHEDRDGRPRLVIVTRDTSRALNRSRISRQCALDSAAPMVCSVARSPPRGHEI
jgi:hypothetical protein